MMRWLLALIIACAMVYLAATVTFEGKTIFDRLLDILGLSQCHAPVERVVGPAHKSGLLPKDKVEDDRSDRLTDQDRAKLDDLIQSKLKEQDKEGAADTRR